jgi:hypothetical protein
MKTMTKRTSSPLPTIAPADPSAILQTERDLKDAIMTVSVFVNLFVLCLWVALQTTAQYDAELAQFFINR